MKTIIKRNINRIFRKKRSRAQVLGTAERPRLSVFRSNRYTYVQLIDDVAGKTLVSASTQSLEKQVKAKTNQAKQLGEIIAKKAKEAGIKIAVFHRGSYKFHGRVKAVAEGAREGGLKL